MFSGLSELVIDAVGDEGSRIVVRARTAPGPAVCSRCSAASTKIHSYHHRTVADLPVDGRVVVLRVRVRRLVCPTPLCCRTFREQVPGLLERYQRRTARLTARMWVSASGSGLTHRLTDLGSSTGFVGPGRRRSCALHQVRAL